MHILSVTESAVRQIREEIITGRLSAGSRLHEVEISERFGISRPPLREAFRTLANENLVVSVPRKGSFVAPMSLEDCEQIYRVRQMLECTAIDIIGERKIAPLAPLREALETTQNPSAQWSVFENFCAMSRFHLRLFDVAGNSWLTSCRQGLDASLARYQVMYLSLPGAYTPSVEEHAQIFALLEAGDYGQAKHHLVAHLDRIKQRLCANIAEGRVTSEGPQELAG